MKSLTLAELGWDSFFLGQLGDLPVDQQVGEKPARVMNVQRSGIHIVGENLDLHADVTGNDFALQLTVGDWLLFDTERNRLGRRLERKSVIKRRAPGSERREQLIAANVDTLLLVSSCNQDFNEARLERYLAISREAGVMAVIVLTKADLTDDPSRFVARATGLAPGIHVEVVNALQRDSLRCLEAWMPAGQTIALLGSSGVGKSTLANTLLGEASIRTRDIRDDDAKGRHTTTSRSMYRLPGGAWLLDTPGMRELQLSDARSGIDDVFDEIVALAADCRFADCAHDGEPGCRVADAIEKGEVDEQRFRRWRKLLREDSLNTATLAEKRARDKSFGRLIKSVVKDKKKQRGL